MHRRVVIIAIALLSLIGVGAGLVLLRNPPAPMIDEPLWGVLVRKQCALASGIDGLYRAERTDRKWHRAAMPPGMPTAGRFASESADAPDVYYYAAPCPPQLVKDGGSIPAMPGIKFGLYRSRDEGRSWKLVVRYNRFGGVYVHPDGALFAMNYGPPPGMPGTGRDEQICTSRDGGVTWRDITNGLGLGSDWMPIFRRFEVDLRHPHLAAVALRGFSSFDNGYGAEDQSYHWKPVEQLALDPADYFQRSGWEFASSWPQSHVEATLGNYFEDEFDSETSICSLAATPEHKAYLFAAAEPKVFRFTVRYLSPDGSIKLTDAVDKWSLRMLDPNGAAQEISFGDSSAQAGAGPEKARIIKIDRAHPYTRQLTMSDADAFELPGIYKAQLRYDFDFPASHSFPFIKREEFVGYFGGPVFTIEIKRGAQQ